MLTRLVVRNFKTLESLDIELGQNVVLIGPNNSGKTSALQALALWQAGLREWLSRRSESKARERSGVTINRRNLTHTPVREARLLWHDKRVTVATRQNGSQDTQPVFLDVLVEGQTSSEAWRCGFEFYYANPESFYCRPLRLGAAEVGGRFEVPIVAGDTKIALLPPMSGLAVEEEELKPGRIEVLIGEGQTARVLRNLCMQVHEKSPNGWKDITERIDQMFGVTLGAPERDPARGTIELGYKQGSLELDITSAGRGLQQTLLLLSHIHANPQAVLLLDEPDAHLEILRQRQIYNLISDVAEAAGSQVISASHSEIILNEAADRDIVIAFVGRPHRINDRGTQVLKALRDIGFDQYFQASIKRGVLYLEGATDLAILRALANLLQHPASEVLEDPFVKYVDNQPQRAADHYYGLREAKPDLRAAAVFDRLDRGLPTGYAIPAHCWQQREIENYLTRREVLMRFAAGETPDDLVGRAIREKHQDAMKAAIDQVESALRDTMEKDPWGPDVKASEEVLPQIFRLYYKKLNVANEMNKRDYHILVRFLHQDEVDLEIVNVLDLVNRALRAPP